MIFVTALVVLFKLNICYMNTHMSQAFTVVFIKMLIDESFHFETEFND